jgi:hypothetical protein
MNEDDEKRGHLEKGSSHAKKYLCMYKFICSYACSVSGKIQSNVNG